MERDIEALIREKYKGDREAKGFPEDSARLKEGEPLAYVIGTLPFLGLTIDLSSRPLIPRPETEWWTELLVERIGTTSMKILDLCAGSGAIGLSVLKRCEHATVSFGELVPEHVKQIEKNMILNQLDTLRATVHPGDLFTPFKEERFDLIATNPPYIPRFRSLPPEVTRYEPEEALYGGPDGLSIIEHILKEVPHHLTEGGEVWMECDIENIDRANEMAFAFGAMRTDIRTDPYGRPRLLVAYY